MHTLNGLIRYLESNAKAHECFAQNEEENLQYADHGAYGQSRRRAAQYRETANCYRQWAALVTNLMEERK